MTALDRLTTRFARIAALDEAAGVLHWDASVMMPEGGGAARGEQLATLAGLSHELLTAPEVAADLSAATAEGDWPAYSAAIEAFARERPELRVVIYDNRP